MTSQSPSKQAPWDLTQFSQLPSAAPLYFPEPLRQSEISSLSKVILVLGKARSHRVPNLGYRDAESPGWLDVSPTHPAEGLLSWQSCQSPIAHNCGFLNHLNTFCRAMFKLNAKFDTGLLLYSLSHFECNGHTVHILTQQHLPPTLTSTVKLSLFMHVHSSPLSLAARFHQCHINHCCYSNNCWAFSCQTSYTFQESLLVTYYGHHRTLS